MSLVKWMRKNNRKIMTFVVIFIMIGFVGGVGLQQFLKRLGTGSGAVIATFGDKERITPLDRYNAGNELKVLRSLYATELLRYRPSATGGPDVKSRLLGYLLFPDSQAGAMVSMEMYQAMARRQLNVTSREIDGFFKQQQLPPDIVWIMLKAEAKQAGCVVSQEQSRATLKSIIPQITGGMMGQSVEAAQVVNAVMNRYGLSEDAVVGVYGELLGILTYANIVTGGENVTTGQLRADAGRNREMISAEMVKFNAADLIDEDEEPAQEVLEKQFEQYKGRVPDDIDSENPYGFGYKLPDRVVVDYLIVKTSDVQETIKEITPEDMEKYYTANLEQFEETYKIDPNAPGPATDTRTKDFADVAPQIKRSITRERTDNLANLIISDALDIAEAAFDNLNIEEATAAELEAAAVKLKYGEVARKIIEKYKVVPSTGRTGMLSMADLANDRNLGMLSLEGQSQMPVQFVKMAFAVEELKATEMGRFEAAAPKMWQNIGPLRPRYGMLVAIARIVDTAKAEVPSDSNVKYSIKGAVVDPVDKLEEASHSVLENVKEDCRLVSAMNVAKERAEEFVGLLGDNKWEEAVDEYNEIHFDPNDMTPGARLRSDNIRNQRRTSERELRNTKELVTDNPMAAGYVRRMIEGKILTDNLYGLIGAGKTASNDINNVMEFKPAAGFYVIKDVSRTEVTIEDYAKAKPMMAFQIAAMGSASGALTHFGPDNIKKRMNFEPVVDEPEEETEEKEDEASS